MSNDGLAVTLACVQANGYTFPPFGIGSIGSFVGFNTGLTPKLFTAQAAVSSRQIAKAIANGRPDAVGLSAYVWNYEKTLQVAALLRSQLPDTLLILGGPNVDRSDEQLQTYLDTGLFDLIVCGEGEGTLAEIALLLRECGPGKLRDKVGERATKWVSGINIDMDRLSHPIIHYASFRRSAVKHGIAHLEGSRGCPFRCSFCDQGWRSVRRPSFEKMTSDLELLKKAGARRICFVDPTFNFDRKRHLQTLELLQSLKLSFHAEVKADLLSTEEIRSLSDCRGSSLEIGLQSKRSATLEAVTRRTDLNRLYENLDALARTSLHLTVNTIFGLPTETLDDWMKSIDYIYGVGDVEITASWLKILPNTDLAKRSSEHSISTLKGSYGHVRRSSTWSFSDLLLAAKMAAELGRVQHQPRHRRIALRSDIRAAHGGSLSRYLLSASKRHRASAASTARMIMSA